METHASNVSMYYGLGMKIFQSLRRLEKLLRRRYGASDV
jgi:hypothetical protein